MAWYRVEVAITPGLADAEGAAAAADLASAGAAGVADCRVVRIFNVSGDISRRQAESLAADLLADKVVDVWSIDRPVLSEEGSVPLEIARHPGVMDPAAQSIRRGAAALGIALDDVWTGKRYLVASGAAPDSLMAAARRVLLNEVIEFLSVDRIPPERPHPGGYEFSLVAVPLLRMTPDEMVGTSRRMVLSLNPAEMGVIQEYFRTLGRDPTNVELETLAQTWSEHCVHKTLKGIINYKGRTIDNLLKSTIARATAEINAPWCLSVFVDNAGVIEFDEGNGVCFKVETHNHPSAIEPYGGAGTGIGGVIRDILGTGLGARPIANTDVFCFGRPDSSYDDVPRGALHPERVMKGVVAGVRDYGNRMGIPTVNGAVCFDERYTGNPLVYCGTLGIIPRWAVAKQARPGDIIVVVGGRTGRDGIHGATFSSVELSEESETVSSGAVQIGNAIEEKRMMDCLLVARDEKLYSAVTDCGAGGLSSAVGEMGEHVGAEVHLEKVPLKYAGLSYTEIWISEAQERMVLAVPPDRLDRLLAVFAAEDVEATPIGSFTGDGMLRLFYRDDRVAELDMDFMHNGLPRLHREASPPQVILRSHPSVIDDSASVGRALVAVLSELNVAGKQWIIRQYDHEVQAGTLLKPLAGVNDDGPSDGAVMRPVPGRNLGVALAVGINPLYGDLSPYQMAANAVDEAVRNAVACGADPERIAILDNFAWGNTDDPCQLGALVEASQACYDVATVYRTPFISGKDSLHNEFESEGGRISIPYTLLISAVGIVENLDFITSMDLKKPGSILYLVGDTRPELSAGHYLKVLGRQGDPAGVPSVRPLDGVKTFAAVASAIRQDLVLACHDLSEGGLAVAAAEMAFAGMIGAVIDVSPLTEKSLRPEEALFSETPSRFLVEVAPGQCPAFESVLRNHGAPAFPVGRSVPGGVFTLVDGDDVLAEEKLEVIKAAWMSPLDY
ncbi:MAG: phosphoribosylformylglycinamidine synthase subunit PurL [Planctomycetes bacterium]|nr:phosphoribosylformylglycinamidine synthase subunit PurL [Planctomycetota bacterium]